MHTTAAVAPDLGLFLLSSLAKVFRGCAVPPTDSFFSECDCSQHALDQYRTKRRKIPQYDGGRIGPAMPVPEMG
eukprot:3941128-Rhodomonas_salina.3